MDVLFQSAAEVYGSRVLGAIMTGMGSDGKQGAAWIKSQGGLIFTESEETWPCLRDASVSSRSFFKRSICAIG